MIGPATDVPSTVFGACLLYELCYPTLGDDGSDSDGAEFVDQLLYVGACARINAEQLEQGVQVLRALIY